MTNTGSTVADPFDRDPFDPIKAVVRRTLMEHVPSLSAKDDEDIDARIADMLSTERILDNADLALRTCACGVKIDGFYSFIDHLTEVFGLEPSHLAG